MRAALDARRVANRFPSTPGLPLNPLSATCDLPSRRNKTTHAATPAATRHPPQASKLKHYADLSKARLSSLVVLTTSCGFLSSGLPLTLSLPTMLGASVGTALCASSASTLNQVLEVERDAKMTRTRSRPLPSGQVSVPEALTLAATTAALGGSALYVTTDPLTTALGVGNILLYAPAYTLSKRTTEWNTWIGAVVGAVPPVMGWTASGGGLMDPECAFLGGALFLWQMPHFFALSWMYREDYKRGDFVMVSSNDPDGSRTSSLITRYTWYLSALPFLSSMAGTTNWMFAVEGVVLNGAFLYYGRKFEKNKTNGNARKVFLTSLWYLPCLLGLFILHSKNWSEKSRPEVEEKVKGLRERGRLWCLHEGIDKKALCPVPHGANSKPK